MRASLAGVGLLVLFVAACGRGGAPAKSANEGAFHVVGVGSPADPTVRPARILPEVVDETQSYGSEPGGGVRAITAGLRVVTSANGSIQAADDRLPQAPQITTALPERLGGGFLFVIQTGVWRADKWLGPARPIFTSSQSVAAIIPGLDRVYIRGSNTYFAIDGRSGASLDLGPWPQSPYVASYAAADGWRAAAVTDLRGVVATFDAGATWRPLDLPMIAQTVIQSGENLAVGGIEGPRSDNVWFEIRGDGSLARLAGAPREAKNVRLAPPPPRYPTGGYYPGGYYPGGYVPPQPAPTASASAKPADVERDDAAASAGVRIFGKRPLAAAIEDGWPLTDGTAVVARDGALGRVRLSDGALTEIAQGAFPLKPSRCHGVSLTRTNAVGAFGFVCGEPRGTTVVYAYDPMHGRLAEIKRFEKPRVVTSSGSGGLAVRGPCAEDADPIVPASSIPKSEPLKPEKTDRDKDKKKSKDDKPKDDDKDKDDKEDKASDKADKDKPAAKDDKPAAPEVHPFCVLGHDNVWREVHVRGDVGGERVVVMADGRIAVVSPPQSQSAPARLTILDKGKAATLPVVFPKVTADIARALRLGVWLDGFEERRPGVLGGWIEANGAMLGLEIALDGKATPGQYIRDAGLPFVSGRYGLGWTASRYAYETTDGGMTWTKIDGAPEWIAPSNKVERRACGPIGCIAAGWLRVGWGETKKPPVPAAPPASYRTNTSLVVPQLQLACEPVAANMPTPAAPRPAQAAAPAPAQPQIRRYGGGPPVLSPVGGFNGLTELPSFYAVPGSALHDPDRGLSVEIRNLADTPNTNITQLGPLARVYGWGPKSGEWDTAGRWQIKWLSPFAGWPEVRSSLAVIPPQVILDVVKAPTTYGYPYYGSYAAGQWSIATGDDPSHALLMGRRMARGNELVLFEVEADHAPVEIRRVDGEPFIEIEAVVRASGRWFVVSAPPPGVNTPMTVLWQIDGAIARELVRVPRAAEMAMNNGIMKPRLARRSDGRAIGLVVDGQSTAERAGTALRWVLPIDLETAQLGEPEPIGYADLAGRQLDACSDDVVGWVLDAPLPSTNPRLRMPGGSGYVHNVYARVRLTTTRACVERIAGMYDGQTQERAVQLTRPGAAATRTGPTLRPGEVLVTATSAQVRYPLRCTVTR
jgi:hypothetical protein